MKDYHYSQEKQININLLISGQNMSIKAERKVV